MNRSQALWRIGLLVVLVLCIGSTLGCIEEEVGPRAWIDFPGDGSNVLVGAPVSVQSHAYAKEGLAEILLSVNGQPYRTSPVETKETFYKATHDWLPASEGSYTLQISGKTKTGVAIRPVSVNVKAVAKRPITPTLTGAATATATATPATPTQVPVLDLAIDTVEPLVIGYKGETPICDIRLVYRNAGTVPIPADYVIQAHLNGTPFASITRGAGFGVGGVSEAIFHYQFTDSAYIGINLDSTNALAESNESNNAFAEARLCGGPTPVRPISITPTAPTSTPTATATRITPLPPPSCSGTPKISSFSASPTSIQRGQSATLNWGAVTNADSVSIEPGLGGVGTPGSRSVSPGQTTVYTLVAACGDNHAKQQATIQVSAPPPPRDTQGPPAPNLRSPRGSQPCVGNVTLSWDAVSDPSGIRDYTVKWVRNDGQSGGTVTGGTSTGISVACGKSYTWSVFATDKAGNKGGIGSAGFSVAGLH